MIFSLEFVLGFCLFALIYNQLNIKAQNFALLIFNLSFVGFCGLYFLKVLLIYSLLIHYLALLIAVRDKSSVYKGALLCALAYLGVFKYFDDFKAATFLLFHNAGILSNTELIFALGLSFYVFASISYLAHIYHHKAQPASFLCLLTYLSFFATFIAGPIFRFERFKRAYDRLKRFYHFRLICALILIALAKKLAIAPAVFSLLDNSLNQPQISYLALINSCFFYSFYLYADFSAYCELVTALALVLGIKLPRNFAYPLSARNIGDFWHRWHISLSSFIKDFIYIKLGGNRHGTARMLLATLISFVLSGIWHGAGAHFALWGLAHALGLIALKLCKIRMPYILAAALSFSYISFCWAFFYLDLDQLKELLSLQHPEANAKEWLSFALIWASWSALGAARGFIYRFAKCLKNPLIAFIISFIWLWLSFAFMPSGVPNFVYASF